MFVGFNFTTFYTHEIYANLIHAKNMQ